MSFRFWRRIRIAPGVTLNLSKSGGSVSFGPRGAKFTVGPHGKRATAGIPGTGLFYTKVIKDKDGRTGKRESPRQNVPSDSPEERLTLGFFKSLITPDDEKGLVEGCRELFLGNDNDALEHLSKVSHLADGAYLAGFLSLKMNKLKNAATYLSAAVTGQNDLGRYFRKYGVLPSMTLAITDEVSTVVGPDIRGVLLGLVEVYQRLAQWDDVAKCLQDLRRIAPDDLVVKLSLAEVLSEIQPNDKDTCQGIIRLAGDIENKTEIHAALMLYKARALKCLGLLTAARDTASAALRRKKDRSIELLLALRYERALIYNKMGQKARARADFERIYAEAPDYEDVAKKLNMTRDA